MKIEDQWFAVDADANIIHARNFNDYKPENRLRHAGRINPFVDKTACGLDFDPTSIIIAEGDKRARCQSCQETFGDSGGG